MKAYSVTDRNCDTGYSYIVFADTRGQAIAYALNHCDDAFSGWTYTEMMAHRRPQLDHYCKGRREMDWEDMDDRVAMVRYAGMYCNDEVDITTDDCWKCHAHFWCSRLANLLTRRLEL